MARTAPPARAMVVPGGFALPDWERRMTLC
jgi:hypothetical protein